MRAGPRFILKSAQVLSILSQTNPSILSFSVPKSTLGPLRMEKFKWWSLTRAPACFSLWIIPYWFIEKVGAFPIPQSHLDPGFFKWRERQTGGSTPENAWAGSVRPRERCQGSYLHLGINNAPNSPQHYPLVQASECIHPGLLFWTINACKVCSDLFLNRSRLGCDFEREPKAPI